MQGPNNAQAKQPLDAIDRVIHEPARFLILTHLYVVESADFIYIMNQTGMTWGNLSSHIKKLREAGYIEVKKEFVEEKPHTLLKMTNSGRKAFEEYRANMRSMLESM
jgi:DNA-binding MarR family transcriptional regulator